MVVDQLIDLLVEQVLDAQEAYPDIELALSSSGQPLVRGTIVLNHCYDARCYTGRYRLQIDIPSDYPASLPGVREVEGRIPKDFHTFSNGLLCLGATVEVRRVFAGDRTIRSFLDRLVLPFLFSHASWAVSGVMPFGELAHGENGILDYYNEQLGTLDDLVSLRLLVLLAVKDIADDAPCPCRSGHAIGDCHRKILDLLRPHQTPEEWYRELMDILGMFQAGKRVSLLRREQSGLNACTL